MTNPQVAKSRYISARMNTSLPHPSSFLPEALTAGLRAVAPEAEGLGQLHSQQLAAIYEQGWFNALVPKTYGSLALSLPEVLQLEEALAWTDGSVGWVVTLCSGAGWFAGFLDPQLAAAVFSHPQACIAGSGAVSGTAMLTEKGYTVTGFWKHASGALQATAFTFNCQVEQDGQALLHPDGSPVVKTFLLKREEVTLHTTWNAMGMIATGSHAFEVRNVAVPANRCFTIAPEHAQLPGPIYQYPFLQLAETTLAVNLSGMAIRFTDLCEALGQRKAQDRPTSCLLQLAADAQRQLNQQRQLFYEAAIASWETLLQKETIPDPLLEQVSAASKALVRHCRQWVNTLFPYCGLEAVDKKGELNRIWRNFHTAGQHALFSPELL